MHVYTYIHIKAMCDVHVYMYILYIDFDSFLGSELSKEHYVPMPAYMSRVRVRWSIHQIFVLKQTQNIVQKQQHKKNHDLHVHKVLCVWVSRAEYRAERFSRWLTFVMCIKFSQAPFFEWENQFSFVLLHGICIHTSTGTYTVKVKITVLRP